MLGVCDELTGKYTATIIVVDVTEITDEGGLTNGTKAQYTAGNAAP